MQVIVGQYNPYTYTFDTVAKSVTVLGIIGWDLQPPSLLRLYNVTRSAWFTINYSTVYSKVLNTYDSYDYTWTFTDIPAGSANGDTLYVYIDIAPKFATFGAELFLAANAAPPIARKYQLIYVGDSITAGVGTTGAGSSASGIFDGPGSYPAQTLALLPGTLNFPTPPFTAYRAFPGQISQWYIDNDLQTTIGLFDKDNYTDIYCIVYWGSNDLASGVTVAGLLANVQTITAALQAAGAKVLIMPVLNRLDAAAPTGIEPQRTTYNNSLFASSFSDGIIDISIYPNIYAITAPNNATYFASPDLDGSSKLHPTNAGAAYLAQGAATSLIALAATPSIPIVPVDYAGNFITAAGITDPTQIAAIRAYVAGMVSSGLWYMFRSIYPFVGGTSTAHKFNLKDPRDLDAAFRLTFAGTPTHDANGVTWNASAWGDTHILPIAAAIIRAQQQTLTYYSRNTPSISGGDMGMRPTNPLNLFINFVPNGRFDEVSENGGSAHTPIAYSGLGMFTISRVNSPTQKIFCINGAVNATETTNVNAGNTFFNMWIGGVNNNGVNTWGNNRNCAFGAFGYGLSPAQEAAHYVLVQAFQTALGRQV